MKRAVAALANGTLDLLILGGGITGAGVALDAALRGLRVGLIDRGDFASGTSSASSKLIHGGLRYLEQAAFGLVYEALAERRQLLRNAPHLVTPLRFVIPFYQAARVPRWKWRVGLTLYDLLAGRGNLHRSRPLSLPSLEAEFPTLQHRSLRGGAEYFDAQMDDARVCLAVLLSAAEAGAHVANYVEAVEFPQNAGQITGVRARDHVTGQELELRARQVLNATGPWVDQVCALAGESGEPHLQPSKGVHVVIPNQGHAAAFLLLHPRDGRVFFVLPWLGKTLIGTTDTFTQEDPAHLTVLPEEIAYLLEGYNHHFTQPLETADILGSFAGLRPLLRARSGEPSSRSREHQLWAGPSGLLSVAGGKYTTYRHMAEQITDQIACRLGCREPCRTHDHRLDGVAGEASRGFETEIVAQLRQQGIAAADEVSQHLLRRYGGRVNKVISYLQYDNNGRFVVPGELDLAGEFAYQREHEMAVFPADHWLRRTRLGLFHPEIMEKGRR